MVQKSGINQESLVFLIAGPTASGKSDLAQNLAQMFQGEIINADSQQVYRGIEIGTGKVAIQDQRVPHWLFELCEPNEHMNAMKFVKHADSLILELHRRGKLPILVGGTGFYLRALLEGLDPLPSQDYQIRKELIEECQRQGPELLHQQLLQIDAELAKKIHPRDSSRIVRFLEIYHITQIPPSKLLKKGRSTKLKFPVISIWLQPDRALLKKQIEHRVEKMIGSGWLQEVNNLLQKKQDPESWQQAPIGYVEMAQVIKNILSLEEAKLKIVQKTHQYAKRQATFFRGLFKNPAYQKFGSRLIYFEKFGCQFNASNFFNNLPIIS